MIALTVLVAILGVAFWDLVYRAKPHQFTADTMYIRRMAYVGNKVSAPYCWRPLYPWLARWFGMKPVSYVANVMGAVLIHLIVGGWGGFIMATVYVLSPFYVDFFTKNYDMGDGVNMATLLWAVYGMVNGYPWWAFIPITLTGFARESIGIAMAFVLLWQGHWGLMWLPLLAIAIAYKIGKEDKDNRHPLVEATKLATWKRWAAEKESAVVNFWHTLPALRGYCYAVPFLFGSAEVAVRTGLLAAIPIGILGIPASGQARAWSYLFPFVVPFFIGCPVQWVAVAAMFHLWWPFLGGRLFDETGGQHSYNHQTRKWCALNYHKPHSFPPIQPMETSGEDFPPAIQDRDS